jgi:hypothetical protein
MNTATKQKKLRTLYEQSMTDGGPRAFRTNWEQSIGVHRDEHGTPRFDPNKREVDYKEWTIGAICDALMGRAWRSTFEQFWQDAVMGRRYEGVGGVVLPGDIAFVSAAIDTIAGLATARALERPQRPEWIWQDFCSVVEPVGEGGFDIITRPNGDKPSTDLAKGQSLPTVQLVASRVHRNRTLEQGLRTKIHRDTIRDDLTGSLMETVDEISDQVLAERERKVADCVMGVSKTSGASNTFALTVSSGVNIGTDGLAIPVVQDGLTFFPWQKGVYGTNSGSAVYSPENGKLTRNYGNDAFTDGAGLQDYRAIVRALETLSLNRDPFTGLPSFTSMQGMKLLVSPASVVQVEQLLQANALWQIVGANGLNSQGSSNTVSPYNWISTLGIQIKASAFWMNRLLDVGATTLAANGTYAHLAFNATSGYTTAASINSALFLGHFPQAVKYLQRIPYTVTQVPLGPQEISEQTVIVQDVREMGQAYWVNPRVVWRAWA